MAMISGLSLKNVQLERHEQRLFQALSFNAKPGQAWQIIGPNGSGKSSLLKVLSGLSKARRGVIQWQQLSQPASLAWLRQHSLYLSHELCLKMHLTVRENLTLFIALQDHATDLHACLAAFDLIELQDRFIATLSAGQQRRASLAKLALSNAAIWLLDEPFTALDQAQCLKLTARLEAFVAQQGLVIFTSHQALSFNTLTCQRCYLEPFSS